MVEELSLQQITASSLIAIWGFIQALLLEYIPGLKTQFGKLSPQWKASFQAISLVVLVALVYVLAGTSILPDIEQNQSTALYLAMTWVAALAANQTSHSTFKKRV